MDRSARRIILLAALLAIIGLLFALIGTRQVESRILAVDFQYQYFPAAEHLLAGESPYREPDADLSDRIAYLYPLPAALLVAPLTILPLETADFLWTFLLINALVLTLFALRVRDWRVFVLVALWPPVWAAFQTGNITLVLVLLMALAWRYRDRDLLPGALVGAAIALKLFLWPVAVWLAATRRYREAAIAVSLGVLSLLTVLPFMSLGDYVRLVQNNDDLMARESYNTYALLHELGASDGVARTAWLVAGIAVLVLVRRSFSLCIVASLLLSPIVWLHYFTLLIVPLAVVRARLWLWALPLAYWLAPGDGNGSTWQLALALAVTAAILAVLAVNLPPTRHARA